MTHLPSRSEDRTVTSKYDSQIGIYNRHVLVAGKIGFDDLDVLMNFSLQTLGLGDYFRSSRGA